MKITMTVACAAASIVLAGCTNIDRQVSPNLSVAPQVSPRYNARHYRWCAQQYTSYRRSTNTYTRSSNLTRRRCVSPYI